MGHGQPVVTHPHPAEALEPTDGSLHHPADLPQPAPVGCLLLGDVRLDAQPAQDPAAGLAVVAPVGVRSGEAAFLLLRMPAKRNGQQLRGETACRLGGALTGGSGQGGYRVEPRRYPYSPRKPHPRNHHRASRSLPTAFLRLRIVRWGAAGAHSSRGRWPRLGFDGSAGEARQEAVAQAFSEPGLRGGPGRSGGADLYGWH